MRDDRRLASETVRVGEHEKNSRAFSPLVEPIIGIAQCFDQPVSGSRYHVTRIDDSHCDWRSESFRSIRHRDKCDDSQSPRLKMTHSPHAASDPSIKLSNSTESAWLCDFRPTKSRRRRAFSENTFRSGPLSHSSMGTVNPRLAWVRWHTFCASALRRGIFPSACPMSRHECQSTRVATSTTLRSSRGTRTSSDSCMLARSTLSRIIFIRPTNSFQRVHCAVRSCSKPSKSNSVKSSGQAGQSGNTRLRKSSCRSVCLARYHPPMVGQVS